MTTEPFGRLRRFLRELKRRNVYKVAVTYLAVAFVGFQAARLLIPSTVLPTWADEFFLFFLIIGFPVALVVAWAFEMSPEGMRRTETPEGEDSIGVTYQWMGLALVVALAGGVWYATSRPGGGGGASESAAATDTARADRSIAVLPFDNLSGTEEAEPFVNGIHDDLLTRLSNISELKVISRTSVLPFRETDLSLPAIADSLGVTWIVEGGVQQAGDRVQVNAQLIQAEEDVHRWAETYRQELTTENLFAVQSELTKKIARSLEARLTSAEQARIERQPTENLEAYRLYVQGRTHLDRRTEEEVRQGVEYFRRALDRDSSYALAWAGLADARTLLAYYGFGPQDSLLAEARHAAERALSLSSDLAEAHASMGAIHMALRRDGPAALQELRRAVGLKPSYAEAHHWLGSLLHALGRDNEGGARLKRAAELDPMSSPIHMGLSNSYYQSDSLERALEAARRARRLSPGYSLGSIVEGHVLSRLGRHEEARAALQRALDEASPGSWLQPVARAWLALEHYRAGDTARAQELLARVNEEQAPVTVAAVQAQMGDRNAAFSLLSRGRFDLRQSSEIRFNPAFDPLRDDPRYDRLIRKINVEWGLNPDGSLPDSVDVPFGAESDE